MTTTVVKTIGSTGDYSTLALWEAASPANLVTADQVWQGQCQNQSFSGAATMLTVSGTTVDATRYVELTTVSGASFRDNGSVQSNALKANASNGCLITSNAAYSGGRTVVISQEFTRLSNLQITNTNANNVALACTDAATATTAIDINNCIIEGAATAPMRIYGSAAKIRNSLVRLTGSSRSLIVEIDNSAQAYNCTFVCASDIGVKPSAGIGPVATGYGSPVIKNCAIFGATAVKTGSSTFTFTTCYTDVASPPTGCTTVTYASANFGGTTIAAPDYRITSGSSLLDVATTDSTNAATDIAGTARPSGSAYDVGAWEFVSAGAGNSIAVPLGSLTLAGQVPTISQTANQVIAVPAGSLTLSAKTPTIAQSANQIVAVPAGTLTLAGQVPTVTATLNNQILVPVGTLALTGYAPTIPGVVSASQAVGGISSRAWVHGLIAYNLSQRKEIEQEVKQFKKKVKRVVAQIKRTGEPAPLPVLVGPAQVVDPVNEFVMRYAERALPDQFINDATAVLAWLDDDDEDVSLLLH